MLSDCWIDTFRRPKGMSATRGRMLHGLPRAHMSENVGEVTKPFCQWLRAEISPECLNWQF